MLSADMEEMALFIKGWAWEWNSFQNKTHNDIISMVAVLSVTWSITILTCSLLIGWMDVRHML